MRHTLRLLPAALLVLVVPAALPGAAFGVTGGAADSDDVALRLDVRAVSHSDDSATVTYAAETYGSFPDTDVDFRWSLDLNGDGRSDLAVATQWEDDSQMLVSSVEDVRERVVARAAVTRPAPDAVQVSFPRTVLGTITSYRYTVIGVTDLDGDGETDTGEHDVVPNTGSIEHRLGAASTSGGTGTSAPPTTVAAPPPGPGANPQNPGTGSGAGSTASPAPGTAAGNSGSGSPPGTSGGSSAATSGGVAAVPRQQPARPGGAVSGSGASSEPSGPSGGGGEGAQLGAIDRSAVPRTGPVGDYLPFVGAALLLAGVACRLVAGGSEGGDSR